MRMTAQRMRFTLDTRALALALMAIGTLAAACGSATTSPEVSTTPAAASAQDFISEWYGFQVTLTEDWSEADAVVDWSGTALEGIRSAAFANFSDPSTGRTLVAAAAPVAKGMALAEWRDAIVGAAPPACSESPSAEETTLGGEPALMWMAMCSDSDAIKLAALHGDRGYVVFLDSPGANDAGDQRIFESIRSSFQFND